MSAKHALFGASHVSQVFPRLSLSRSSLFFVGRALYMNGRIEQSGESCSDKLVSLFAEQMGRDKSCSYVVRRLCLFTDTDEKERDKERSIIPRDGRS